MREFSRSRICKRRSSLSMSIDGSRAARSIIPMNATISEVGAIAPTRPPPDGGTAGSVLAGGERVVATSLMAHLHASNEERSRLTGVWTVVGFRLSEATTSTHHGSEIAANRRRASLVRIWRYQMTRAA